MTQLIGFKRYGEEYKMMGLSSYGKPKFKTLLKDNLFINQNLFELNIKFLIMLKEILNIHFLDHQNKIVFLIKIFLSFLK